MRDVVDADVKITKVAANPKRKKAKVTFKGTDNLPVSELTFECRVDAKPFAPCTSPQIFKRLKPGRHKVEVRATDAAGNVDSTPAKKSFKLKKKRKRR